MMMQLNTIKLLLLLVLGIMLGACQNPRSNDLNADTEMTPTNNKASSSALDIEYEKYTLDNGLTVILHKDDSDPIVAISTVVHVGSNREKPGRTGFAHFFEHMAFNDSENVPKGANRKMIPELGGTRNGGTWSDGTIYYEVVPKDAFDKLLWIDSDRLGYMINTVTQPTLEREKQVVKNEKRQRVDNRAYGHTDHVIRKALYPTGHPYNWTVIGDLEDLQAATLDDVKAFYFDYYVPSNVTIVIAGDIDIEQTKEKVEYWFGEISAGEPVEALSPIPVSLSEDVKLFHEDNFARLPELRLTFPTIHSYHPDEPALDMLGALLAGNKDAPLYEIIVENEQLAPSVAAYHSAQEIAGTFTIRVRAKAGVALDDVKVQLDKAIAQFKQEGVTENQLTRIKATTETSFYQQYESVLNKSLQLGILNEYAGSPDYYKEIIKAINAVTRDDIMRVFDTYVYNKPSIMTSFVPKGQLELVLSGSKKANVVEEQIVEGAEPEFEESDLVEFVKTPTKNDRSEPPLSDLPALQMPEIKRATTANGINVYAIENRELPLVYFSLTIPGGQLLDPKGKEGTANLLANMLVQGTQTRSAAEFEEALELLGAKLQPFANKYEIGISGSVLAKNFTPTMQLLQEMLLLPALKESDFERLKKVQLSNLKQRQGNPNSVAFDAFALQLYGAEHPLSVITGGVEESVQAITLKDLQQYYQQHIKAKGAHFHIVGSMDIDNTLTALGVLADWQGKVSQLPPIEPIASQRDSRVFFLDVPNAKQSVIYMGKLLPSSKHPDIYPIEFANTSLGGGISGRLAQTLRIQKGYTYGAYSTVSTNPYQSIFIASSQVRTNVTKESLDEFKRLVGDYQLSFDQDDLDVMRNMVIKGNSRRFETLNSQLNILQNLSEYGLADDYIMQQQDYVLSADLAEVHRVINTYLDESQMIYVVAGDAKSQKARVAEFAAAIGTAMTDLSPDD